MITQNITDLVRYGVSSGLVDEADIIYTVNKLLNYSSWKNMTENLLLRTLPK